MDDAREQQNMQCILVTQLVPSLPHRLCVPESSDLKMVHAASFSMQVQVQKSNPNRNLLPHHFTCCTFHEASRTLPHPCIQRLPDYPVHPLLVTLHWGPLWTITILTSPFTQTPSFNGETVVIRAWLPAATK